MVQGTFGYLDPEYLQTNHLTEKSDVYSFGVVLVELLTSRRALSFEGPEKERHLSQYFLSVLKENQLFKILDAKIVYEENTELLQEVALLAKRCLNVKGEDRPTMKEVAMKEVAVELTGLRRAAKHPWTNNSETSIESEALLTAIPFGYNATFKEERNLSLHFLSSLKENRLFMILDDNIVCEENTEELQEFALLAKRCLNVNGEDRPTMKEVAVELGGLMRIAKHPWINNNSETSMESHALLIPFDQYDATFSITTTTEYDSLKHHMKLPGAAGR
nr:putative wall-associated receptor kinase-like 16 [Ipomoea batatas]